MYYKILCFSSCHKANAALKIFKVTLNWPWTWHVIHASLCEITLADLVWLSPYPVSSHGRLCLSSWEVQESRHPAVNTWASCLNVERRVLANSCWRSVRAPSLQDVSVTGQTDGFNPKTMYTVQPNCETWTKWQANVPLTPRIWQVLIPRW